MSGNGKLVSLEKKAQQRNARLRLDAGLAYMTDPERGSIEQLAGDERFQLVSKRTLERWASEDRWTERRAEWLDEWGKIAKAKIGSALCRQRQDEFEQLIAIRQQALALLADELTQPKSWEGVAKVLLEINKRIEGVAISIGNELMPGRPGGVRTDSGSTQISDVEREALTKQILAMRRAEVRDQLVVDVPSSEHKPSSEHEPTSDEP